MEKKQCRKDVQQALANMSYQDYCTRSKALGLQLLNEPAIRRAKTIAITLSNRPEIDTTFIIEELWRMNKQVVVPKCIPADRSMQFYEIESFAQTERSFKDILEPIPDFTELVDKSRIDVVVVPGVVFDRSGYRIGFGGGYYDRYLEQFGGVCIALAFDAQLIDEVPKESHDLPVHILITENERILCR